MVSRHVPLFPVPHSCLVLSLQCRVVDGTPGWYLKTNPVLASVCPLWACRSPLGVGEESWARLLGPYSSERMCVSVCCCLSRPGSPKCYKPWSLGRGKRCLGHMCPLVHVKLRPLETGHFDTFTVEPQFSHVFHLKRFTSQSDSPFMPIPV